MKVIVGLGNPGSEYKNTRHNLGFYIIDKLLELKNTSNPSEKHKSLIYKHENTIFCKPQTFMNNSGEALMEIKNFYKLKNKDFLVIYDDLYISTGSFKYSLNRSSGGHNGIKSIINCLENNNFPKLRVGIGPREKAEIISEYVLGKFSKEENKKIDEILPKILESIQNFIDGKEFDQIQNKFNFLASDKN